MPSRLPHGLANRAFCAALALAFGTLLAVQPATAQTTVSGIPPITVQTQARATVLTPLSFVWVDDLDFGMVIPATTAGTVTVSPITSACSTTGPIVEIGTCKAARFAGRGARNMNVRVSLSSVANLTGPGQTMVLDTIKLDNDSTLTWQGNGNSQGHGVGLSSGNGNQRYKIADPNGIFGLRVGGTLHVNANQAFGTYTGSVTITVQYN